MTYDYLVDTYETERLKTVSVWTTFRDEDLRVRPRPGDSRGGNALEHMVHQCVSEDLWFREMLGIDVGTPPLPEREERIEFIRRYAEDSGPRLDALPSATRPGGKATCISSTWCAAARGSWCAASPTPRTSGEHFRLPDIEGLPL